MKIKIGLVILINFIWINSNSQDSDLYYFVLPSSGINLRLSPNINGKVISKIPFGEKVKYIHSSGLLENFIWIDSLFGEWVEVNYHDLKGFVWSPYISSQIKINNPEYPENSPQIFYEGIFENGDGIVYFNPKLNWYGIYKVKYGFERRKVYLTWTITPTGNKGTCDQLLISTNKNVKSMFLFGIKNDLADTMISNNINVVNLLEHNRFIYPGQFFNLGYSRFNNEEYILTATGNVDSSVVSCSIDNYKLRYATIKDNNYKHQDLMQSISNKGECGMPEVMFIGDLDDDNIPDLILYASKTSQYRQATLFLSSYGSGAMILKRMADYDYTSCYE